MAWSATAKSDHQKAKLCKDEQSEKLALGLIASRLPSVSQEVVRVARKRHHQMPVNQKGYVAHDDDLSDDLVSNVNEKKRRLTVDQVNYLEMSFSMDLKLEPERKALIAKHLGLRPRQVAIWFQNRRARGKNKQLEQDYEALKASHDYVVQENETMVKKNEAINEDNKRLQAEVARLTRMLENRKVPSSSDAINTSSHLDLGSDLGNALKGLQQFSNNSELASPTKSDAHSESLDLLEAGCLTSQEAIVAVVDQPSGEINSFVACAAVKFEADYTSVRVDTDCQLLAPSDEIFINHPQLVSGFYVDDLLLSYEDHLFGFTWSS